MKQYECLKPEATVSSVLDKTRATPGPSGSPPQVICWQQFENAGKCEEEDRNLTLKKMPVCGVGFGCRETLYQLWSDVLIRQCVNMLQGNKDAGGRGPGSHLTEGD